MSQTQRPDLAMGRVLGAGEEAGVPNIGPIEIVCLVAFVIGLIILVRSFARRR
jgi:hypothetical protein